MHLAIDNLSAGYKTGEVLHNLAFSASSGDFIGIIGPNGAGKSTLIKVLAGLIHPFKGAVKLNNRPLDSYSLSQRAREIAYLPQQTQIEFSLTVRQTVMMGRYPYQGLFGRHSAEDESIVDSVLNQSQLEALANRPVDTLSGGQRQRVWLAGCLVQQAPIILLDEPTAALDPGQTWKTLSALKQMESHCAGRIVVGVFHDLDAVKRFCNRVIALKDGGIIADGAPQNVLSDDFIHTLYDIPLLETAV